MTTEMSREIDSQRDFYEVSKPETMQEYFRNGVYKVAVGHARKDMIPQIEIVNFEDVDSLDKTARLLATVEDVNEGFKNIDPTTDQGKFDLAVEIKARGISQAEQTSDPKAKAEILKTVDWVVGEIFDSVSKVTSKVWGKKGVMALSGLAVGVAACSPNVVIPPYIPDGGDGTPTATEVSPVSPTAIPTETASPTPTPEVEHAFIPEGFSPGTLGLLKSPETGKDIVTFNPEADWEKVREEILTGLWVANNDWAKWTGETNDATKYKTKEDFIKAAEDGTEFHIGIPVRLDGNLIPTLDERIKKGRYRLVTFEYVDITLNNINVQVLAPSTFKELTGLGWSDNEQPAYDASIATTGTDGSGAAFFSEQDGTLVVSVGSLYFGNEIIVGSDFLLGNFNPSLYEKYPTYFRQEGIGVKADNAGSWILGMAIDELNNFPRARYNFSGVDGQNVKTYITWKASTWDTEAFFVSPPLFTFAE